MLLIHQLIEREKYPNSRTLAETLEVSRKTVLRDIEFMTLQLELPIKYNAAKRGYYYARHFTRAKNENFVKKLFK